MKKYKRLTQLQKYQRCGEILGEGNYGSIHNLHGELHNDILMNLHYCDVHMRKRATLTSTSKSGVTIAPGAWAKCVD